MKKSTLALAFAVVLAVLAVVAVRSYLEDQKKEIKSGLKVAKVLIAAEIIPPGEPLRRSQVEEFEIPVKCLLDEMILASDSDRILGKKSPKQILRGHLLLEGYFREAPPTHKVSIPGGMRICSLGVNMISGVSGLVSPGDYVDVIWTFRGSAAGAESTVTLFNQVLVYAVDDITQVGYRPERRIRGNTRGPTPYTTVTLLLFPLECELMTYALSQGDITLAKRPPADASAPPSPGIDNSSLDDMINQAKRTRSSGGDK